MKTYVIKIGTVYLLSDGTWSHDQQDALLIEAPHASAMRVVRLKLNASSLEALICESPLPTYDKYDGL